jgi:hypothetical protein
MSVRPAAFLGFSKWVKAGENARRGNAKPFVVEPAATRGRVATEGGDHRPV